MAPFAVSHRLFMPVLLLALMGCGIAGGTRQLQVSPDAQPKTEQLRPTTLASIAREDAGIRLMTYLGVVWGKFNDADQSNIGASIREGLADAAKEARTVAGEPVEVHVLIRKYFVGARKTKIAVFAGVDWAVATWDKEILYQESFYATNRCTFPQLCTLGSIKENVNQAIIDRIAKRAILIASGRGPEDTETEGTYTTFEEAVATMPEVLNAWGEAFVVGSVPVVVPGSPPQAVSLDWADMGIPIDWSGRLRDAKP